MSKVFVIDDDPIHQRIAQILIAKNNLFSEVVSFLEAENALRFIQENSGDAEALPDVILLDLNMPAMNGWDFLDAYQLVKDQLAKPLRIFIVSSSVDEKDRIKAQEYETVLGFICKPLSVANLEETRHRL